MPPSTAVSREVARQGRGAVGAVRGPGRARAPVSTLLAVAASTGADGKGAYISAATVAQLTRKTERTAKKDLAELTRLGLLLPGNQRIVAHIRSDRRPNVYDLPMPRGVAQDTPSSPNGVSHTTARGVVPGPNGVSTTRHPKRS